MKKLTKLVYIILFLILVVVLIFFVMDRLGVQTPLSDIDDQYCGDNICQSNENHDNCCTDCGCLNDEVCVDNKCGITQTTSIPSTTETTIVSIPSGGGGGENGGGTGGGGSGSVQGSGETTTTTLGCSYERCGACENKTACYDVGCVWCLTERCLRICKGQVL